MTLSACFECVGKGYIYTSNEKNSCVYSLKNIQSSTVEIVSVSTKLDCIVKFLNQDSKMDLGIFGWGLPLWADLCIVLLPVIGIMLLVMFYEMYQRAILEKQFKAVLLVLTSKGFISSLDDLPPVPGYPILTFFSNVFTCFHGRVKRNSEMTFSLPRVSPATDVQASPPIEMSSIRSLSNPLDIENEKLGDKVQVVVD